MPLAGIFVYRKIRKHTLMQVFCYSCWHSYQTLKQWIISLNFSIGFREWHLYFISSSVTLMCIYLKFEVRSLIIARSNIILIGQIYRTVLCAPRNLITVDIKWDWWEFNISLITGKIVYTNGFKIIMSIIWQHNKIVFT